MRLRYLYLSLIVLALAMFTSAPRLMADGVHHCDKHSDAVSTDFSSFGNHGDTLIFANFQQDKGGDWDWKGAKWDNDGGGRNWWNGKDYDGDPKTTSWANTPEPSVLTLLLASVVSLLGVTLLKKVLA